jgi:sec-independent protein translocase protein TatA
MQRPDLALAFGFSGWEWLIILIVALLLFGRRLPDIMRGLGSSVKEFKKGMDDVQSPASAPPPAPSGAVAREAAPPPAPPAAQPPAEPAAPAQAPPKA